MRNVCRFFSFFHNFASVNKPKLLNYEKNNILCFYAFVFDVMRREMPSGRK